MRGVHRLSMPGAGGFHRGASGDDTYLLHQRRRRTRCRLPGRGLEVDGGLCFNLPRGGGGRRGRFRVLDRHVGGSSRLGVLRPIRGNLSGLFLRHALRRAAFRSCIDHVRGLMFSVRLRVGRLHRAGSFGQHLVLLGLRLVYGDLLRCDVGH